VTIQLATFIRWGTCAKCRGRDIRTTFHPSGQDQADALSPLGTPWPCSTSLTGPVADRPEHMCRICSGCGHGWVEAPADAVPARPTLRDNGGQVGGGQSL
jgi:hypothetical protein